MDIYFWSHECLLHTKELVEDKVYTQMRSGAGGISGHVRGGGGWSWQAFSSLWGTSCFHPLGNVQNRLIGFCSRFNPLITPWIHLLASCATQLLSRSSKAGVSSFQHESSTAWPYHDPPATCPICILSPGEGGHN